VWLYHRLSKDIAGVFLVSRDAEHFVLRELDGAIRGAGEKKVAILRARWPRSNVFDQIMPCRCAAQTASSLLWALSFWKMF
jgi:hypothetical protein